jgi:hypothetical protein
MVAAFYSIVGLTTIFAGAFWPIVIMGSVLEVGKLVATSWLYNNWSVAPRFIKYYLTVAVTVLMLITSMGIFGFLSKAHIEQTLSLNTGVTEQIQVVDSQIKFIEDSIYDIDKQVAQIDSAIDKMTERNQAQSSLRAADQQRKTRTELVNRKQEEIKKLSLLKTEKIKFESEFKKIEAEVGPIKYVAEIIYGGSDKEVVDKAIRFVIILLIFVFDPLAILLLLAYNVSKNRDSVPEFLDMSEVTSDGLQSQHNRSGEKAVGIVGSNRKRKRLQSKETDD